MNATLISKLAAASIKVGALATDKRNTQQGYNYISADKILDRAGNALAGVGIVIIPAITEEHIERVQTDKGGARYDALVKFVMTITDSESSLEYPWVGRGSDYVVPDKAFYKAVTSGHRYFLTKLLNIGVGNEDGEHESEPQQKPQERTNGAAVSQPAAPAPNALPSPATPDTAQADNPFEKSWYAAALLAISNANPYPVFVLCDDLLTLHRNNGGPCSPKQYGYLCGLLDSIIEQATGAEDGHKRVLSVLCQMDVTGDNRPSATMAGRLLARLATHIKDDAGNKVINPNYDQTTADAMVAIYRAAENVGTPSLLEPQL